MKKKKFA